MILHDAIGALHALLSTKGFRYSSGLSVQPGIFIRASTSAIILHLLSQHPRLWRMIVLEGVASGALLFEACGNFSSGAWLFEACGYFAVVLANPNWRSDFTSRPEDKQDEILACLKAMAEPYPETLPDPAWRTGTRVRETF